MFPKKSIFLILLLVILLSIIFTFPLALKINSFIPGFHSTDEPYAALWYFCWVKHAYLKGVDSTEVTVIAAPFGITIKPGYLIWTSINRFLSITTNPVFAYNAQIILSFILSGISAYLLGFYVLRSVPAAIFVSIIFAFCPYHFVRSLQHLGLAQIQWLPLYLLALLFLYNRRSYAAAAIVGLSFALVMSFDLYYAYFMFIVTIFFFLYCLSYDKKLKTSLKLTRLLLVAAMVAALVEAPDIYNTIMNIASLKQHVGTHGVYGYIRPFEDLFVQSARPLSYFLPAFSHPIFGRFTEQFIGTSLYGTSYTEHTLYLGWVPIAFAFIALKSWLKDKKKPHAHQAAKTPEEKFFFGFFIFLTLAAWLFSQPPWWNIFGFKLYMPSFFMYKIAPMFRAYCRFGIIVMLGIAMLAGYGLKHLLERFQSVKIKIFLISVFCGLVLFEFWNYPPYKVIDVSRAPEVYYWLKTQPGDFTIAEYPLDTEGANELYRFCQSVHEKKIINITTPGTYANEIAKTITKLSDPIVTAKLKWMGVKYVLVHKDGYRQTGLTEDEEELKKIPFSKNLKYIKTFSAQTCPKETICTQKTGPIDVYEVDTVAVKPEIK